MENSNLFFHIGLLHIVLSGIIGLWLSLPCLCLVVNVTDNFFSLCVLFLKVITLAISEITENTYRQQNLFKYMCCSLFCLESLPSAIL